jgi:hypothetical protein
MLPVDARGAISAVSGANEASEFWKTGSLDDTENATDAGFDRHREIGHSAWPCQSPGPGVSTSLTDGGGHAVSAEEHRADSRGDCREALTRHSGRVWPALSCPEGTLPCRAPSDTGNEMADDKPKRIATEIDSLGKTTKPEAAFVPSCTALRRMKVHDVLCAL